MRVLHLPTTVGGHSSGLSKELNKLGIYSEVWTINQNYLQYPVDKVITSDSDGPILRMLKICWAGKYVWGKWDVVHFNSGSTLFSMRFTDFSRSSVSGVAKSILNSFVALLQRLELYILKLRKVSIFIHYQGDDARQGDISQQLFRINIASQVEPGYYTSETDQRKRDQIKFLSTFCSKIYAVNPDLLHFLPPRAEFIPYSHVAISEIGSSQSGGSNRPLRLVHAPSHRLVKGTQLILDSLEELKQEGYSFELTLVEGKSNAEALEIYRNSDVLIDQLFAGWYGGLALECMAMGLPVMAFIRDDDLVFIPDEMNTQLPIIRTNPETIKEDLRLLLLKPQDEIIELSRKSRAFAEKWHNPIEISRRILNDYKSAAR